MSSKQSRTKAQAKRDRAQLKKLSASGLYSGKLDLRKAPSRYQRKLLDQFKDVVTGKAVVAKPKDAKRYARTMQVVGDKVIVPKRKGERIGVNKRGNIETVRTEDTGKRKRKIRSTIRTVKVTDKMERPSNSLTVFKVPFFRGKRADGSMRIEYRRFTYDNLFKFMQEYKIDLGKIDEAEEWLDTVIEETVSFPNEQERKGWETQHARQVFGWGNNGADYKERKGKRNIRKLTRELLRGETQED